MGGASWRYEGAFEYYWDQLEVYFIPLNHSHPQTTEPVIIDEGVFDETEGTGRRRLWSSFLKRLISSLALATELLNASSF